MTVARSQMLELGSKAPDFVLPDVVSGKSIKLSDFDGKKAFLAVFMCRHCPYVQHVEEEIAKIGKDYEKKDFAMVAVSANDVNEYPSDSPENLKKQAERLGFGFPYLYDEDQEVAKAYTASCTPDFFLFDEDQKLVYRGQLDDSRPGNDVPVTGEDLRSAIDEVLNDEKVAEDQKPSSGCNIKWKPGNEPDYFG